MHWIQRHILLELTRHSTRRYSQLRPDNVEGNLFLYHLEGLMKDGLVEKIDRTYRLSTKGLRFIGTYSLQTGQTRLQPKILTAISCHDDQGRQLLIRWRREPNTGLISFPHGMVHYGHTIAEMAATELAEKAAVRADLKHTGDIYIRGFLNGEIDRHMLIHLFSGTNLQPIAPDHLRPEVCESFWDNPENLESTAFVPGFYELMQIAGTYTGQFIVAELDIEIPDRPSLTNS